MRNLLQVVKNTALVVGGFFAVLFGVSRFSQDTYSHSQPLVDSGVVHADAPTTGYHCDGTSCK